MRTDYLPTKDSELVTYSSNISTFITATPTVVGLTAGQASTFAALNTTWVNAYNASASDTTRSKVTIQTKKTAKTAMIANLRMLVGIIQKYPGTTDTQRQQLGINVRKTPGPKGNPGTPYKLLATLTSTGNINLSWKNTNATGCVYNIWRQNNGAGSFDSLGGSGAKKFTDSTIPAGATQLQYQIQAVRSTGVSEFAVLDVKFGPGSATITTAEGKSLKEAA